MNIGTVFHSTFLAVILVEQAAHSASGAAQVSLLHLLFFLLSTIVLWQRPVSEMERSIHPVADTAL